MSLILEQPSDVCRFPLLSATGNPLLKSKPAPLPKYQWLARLLSGLTCPLQKFIFTKSKIKIGKYFNEVLIVYQIYN